MKKLSLFFIMLFVAMLFVNCESNSPTGSSSSKGIGVFSVGEGKTVTFSPGNLQYHPANNEWHFAENQWDYVGEANSNISSTYDGWIDLFGWSADNTSAPFGVSTSTNYNDYSGSFVDWGTNKIGNDAPNTWRTLTHEEWMYIFYDRENAQSLFALGNVDGMNGMIILPDNWTTPAGVNFAANTTFQIMADGYIGGDFSHNTYTSEQWMKMEKAGAVFLPAGGGRVNTDLLYIDEYGHYWSSEIVIEDQAASVVFCSDILVPYYTTSRLYSGLSVRLAKDL